MRVAIGACIVVVMVSITVIALKVGARESSAESKPGTARSHATAPAAPTSSGTSGSAKKSTTSARQGSIEGPKTTEPPAHKTPPADPADLGVLVNKSHPLKPARYAPKNLASIGEQRLRTEAAGQLRKLFKAASRDGVDLTLLSGYRSARDQAALHENYVQVQGAKTADRLSAKAGVSEHQTGLAADVGSGQCDLKACFASTAAGKGVAKHAHEYGFIVRYPKGQEKVTGYDYEPWHLRFLGTDLTEDYVASGAKTLEAYYGLK
jgi:D-alanyl-D-alanine carboxypeptidase